MPTYTTYSNLRSWSSAQSWVFDPVTPLTSVVGDIIHITGGGSGATGPNAWRAGDYTVGNVSASTAVDGFTNQYLCSLSAVPTNNADGTPCANTGTPAHTLGTAFVGTAPVAGLTVGLIGDSITQLASVGAAVLSRVTTLSGLVCAVVNRGASGRTSTSWLPTVAQGGEDGGGGVSLLQGAIAAFNAAGVTLVCICLGTNDSKTGPAQALSSLYLSNLQLICDAVALQCPLVTRISLNAPFSPLFLSRLLPGISPFFDVRSPGLVVLYGSVPPRVTSARTRSVLSLSGVVCVGDISLPGVVSAHPEYSDDGLHPNGAGAVVVGNAWGSALLSALPAFGNPLPLMRITEPDTQNQPLEMLDSEKPRSKRVAENRDVPPGGRGVGNAPVPAPGALPGDPAAAVASVERAGATQKGFPLEDLGLVRSGPKKGFPLEDFGSH